MNKASFLTALSRGLSGLPEEEIKKQLDYYGELIADMTEDGMTEEQAVAKLGDLNEIIRGIREELGVSAQPTPKPQKGKGLNTAAIVVLVVCAPMWVPLLLALGLSALAIYFSAWVVVASIFVVVLSLVFAGFVVFLRGLTLFPLGIGNVLFTLGAGIGFLGAGCLALILGVYAVKGLILGTKWFCVKISGLFRR